MLLKSNAAKQISKENVREWAHHSESCGRLGKGKQ